MDNWDTKALYNILRKSAANAEEKVIRKGPFKNIYTSLSGQTYSL